MDITTLDPAITKALTDAVLAILVAILGALLFSAKQVYASWKASAGKNEIELVNSIVADAVHYAEQSGLRDKLVSAGAAKKKLAEDYAVSFLAKYNLKVTADQLDKLLEQAVHKEFNF